MNSYLPSEEEIRTAADLAQEAHPYAPRPIEYALRTYLQVTRRLRDCCLRNRLMPEGATVDEAIIAAVDQACSAPRLIANAPAKPSMLRSILQLKPGGLVTIEAPVSESFTVDRALLQACQDLVERVLVFAGEHPDPVLIQLQHELAELLAAPTPLSTPQDNECNS
jgi:hypothetical protein